ncbi:LysM peptidoglycan-binding domain-containing protein [Bacillus dakarensis]|uniref:LysM peptidoglycan-binding domain-containing protein n=1 Tax=Robertmurraya dakarensis TaxID=1926278 RepID=UPI0009FF0382|nr:LysM domain-containing protein [Bacillus dakarensis]
MKNIVKKEVWVMDHFSIKFILYKIKNGDTICCIAKKFGITIEMILEANKNKSPRQLTVGDTLRVPIIVFVEVLHRERSW